MQKMWIYNKDNGNWYTPEEFFTKYGDRDIHFKDLEKFVIRDPVAGIRAAHKQMKEQALKMQGYRDRLEAFSQKVAMYYQSTFKLV